MKRLIIVDGHAFTKKTEIARQIADRVSAKIYSFTGEVIAPSYVQAMKSVIDQEESVVIESSWRADVVRESLGSFPMIPLPHRRMLDRLAMGCSAHIAQVHSYAYHKNSELTADEKATLDKISTSWLMNIQSGIPVTRIDEGDHQLFDIDLLIDRMSAVTPNLGPGIGAWRPGEVTLLVGDRHGPSIQPYKVDANVAFIDMAKAGSSYWLTTQLIQANIQECKLYWINAYSSDGSPTDPGFIKRLRPISVLTLGDSASRWCDTYHVRYEPFKHPQHHKRFRYGQPYPLIERLKELVADESSLELRNELKINHN